MMKKFLVAGAVSMLLASSTAMAGQLDAYKNMLANKQCTIKYEYIYQDERDKFVTDINRYVMKYMAKSDTEEKPNFAGVIVLSGDNSYTERELGPNHYCEIKKDGYVYPFKRFETDKGIKYQGNKEEQHGILAFGAPSDNKVEAHPVNDLRELRYGNEYGGGEIATMLDVIHKDETALRPGKVYWLAASGSLSSGLTYEDYQWAGANGDVDLIRYYFNQGALTKIASVHYVKKSDGSVSGKHYVVNIKEFSSVPDENYLKLPEALKDVTKYDKEGK